MPTARLTRKPLFGRPRRGRVSTPFGWLNVDVSDRSLDIIECDMSNGQIRALVAQGWSLEKAPPPPAPEPEPKLDDETEEEPQDAADAPQASAPTLDTPKPGDEPQDAATAPDAPATPESKPVSVTSMTVAEIEAAADSWDGNQLAAAIIEERQGKNRKGAMRALGVEVD